MLFYDYRLWESGNTKNSKQVLHGNCVTKNMIHIFFSAVKSKDKVDIDSGECELLYGGSIGIEVYNKRIFRKELNRSKG